MLAQGLDQVYHAKDGAVVVIEAKGGSSQVGHAYGHQQGTAAWAVESAKRVGSSAKASAAERRAASAVLQAARDGKLMVQVVRTKHVLGEPIVAVLESSLHASPTEGRLAARILEDLKRIPAAAVSVQPGLVAKATTAPAKTVAGTVAKIGKAAGAIGVGVDATLRLESALAVERKFNAGRITSKERLDAHAENAGGMVGGLAGAWAGAAGGALIGAALGAFLGPAGAGVAALVGGAIGAIGGYIGGEGIGGWLAQFWRAIWS